MEPHIIHCTAAAPAPACFAPMPQPIVHTMHWDNIPSVILQKQREVFAALDVPLQQESAHRIPHGTWMNSV
eukprot:gene38248-47225_t